VFFNAFRKTTYKNDVESSSLLVDAAAIESCVGIAESFDVVVE